MQIFMSCPREFWLETMAKQMMSVENGSLTWENQVHRVLPGGRDAVCAWSQGVAETLKKNEDSLCLANWTLFSHVIDPFSQLIFCFPIVSNQSPSDKNVNICLNSSVHDNQLITAIMIVRNFLSNYPISKGFRRPWVLVLLLDFKNQSFSKDVIQKTLTKTCQ